MSEKLYHVLGKDLPRKDGAARVTGKELYPSDVSIPGMLHGKILRSPHPHAVVKRIDFSRAEEMGVQVLSFDDVPSDYFNLRQISVPRSTYKDWQVLSDHVRQVGDPFSAVAAETEELAERAAEAVELEWEMLPAYMSVEDATAAQNNQIHEKVYVEDREIPIAHNTACTREVSEGDVDEGFLKADVIVENQFSTPRVYHAQLEPRSCVCRPEPDGGITLWPSTQALHNTRILIGNLFNIPLNKVNVKRVAGGGHFGSGIHTNPVILITVALALKTGRPVRIVQSREEDMYDHCRYQTTYTLKIGARKDGTLVAGEMHATVDIGCHHIQALAFLGVLAGWWHSLYRMESMRYRGVAVYTNKAPTCAMQGYGAPQVTFGVETTMNMIAEKLDMDPLELRLQNYVGLGEIFWGQGPSIKSLIHSDGVKELLQRGSELIGWQKRPVPGSQKGRFRRGIGMVRDTKKILLEYASRILDASVDSLKTRPDPDSGQGVIYVVGMQEKKITIQEVATTAMNKDWGTVISARSVRKVNCPPAYTAFFVEVEVDVETGTVRILRVAAGSDAGTVINPSLAEGQIHGGFNRGAGMALMEDTAYDPVSGRLTNNGMLTDYKMLGIADMPEPEDFRVFFANTYEPTGPMGAKGIGEAALNPVPAAVASAVHDATGIWFTKLPILPEDIVNAFRRKGSKPEKEAAHV